MESIALRLQSERAIDGYALCSCDLLIDKAEHLRARFLANSLHGLQKPRIVFRELTSGRYARFSGTFKGVLKDLFASPATSKSE